MSEIFHGKIKVSLTETVILKDLKEVREKATWMGELRTFVGGWQGYLVGRLWGTARSMVWVEWSKCREV